MTAILLNESRQLRRNSLILTAVFVLTSAFFLAVFPAMKEEAELIQDAYPEFMAGFIGLEELHTIEGFAAGYIYPLVWVLFGGVYFAYLGGGMVAGDIQSRKMDLTLSNPVSRESVLVQKVAALWVPLAALNVGLFGLLYVGAVVLGESLDPVALAMTHVLSVPYLLVCAAIGLVLSVAMDRPGRAQVTALALVFMLWLVNGISEMQEGYEWLGAFTPSRYYDPVDILVHEDYAFLDASILLVTFLAALVVAIVIFIRRDI